jgi:hypothetical protein
LTSSGFAGPLNGTVGATTPAAGAFTTVSASGVATFSAGTVSLPAITTTGDTNTGIFFPAADTIAFTEGGAEAMRIDSSGKVGINVTPVAGTDAKLQVTGGTTNASTLATSYSAATTVIVPKSTSGYSLAFASGSSDLPQLQVSANGASSGDLLIQPYGGNVGIGTSSPAGKLDVSGNCFLGGLRINGSNTTETIYQATGDLGLSAASASNILFRTNGSERLRIASTGAIGLSGANYGSSGQVLTSAGSGAAPTWTTVGGGSAATPTALGTVYGSTLDLSGNATTAVGFRALNSNTGSSNVAVGTTALYTNTSGARSVAVGYQALYANTTGLENTGVGGYALAGNTTGVSNSALGYSALRSNTTGSNLTAIGTSALYSNTTASNNTAVGTNAGYNNTTGHVDAFGLNCLGSNTTGDYNSAFGQQNGYYAALQQNTTGSSNSAFATGALGNNTTGGNNSAFGVAALYNNTTASYTTAVGYQAGYNSNPTTGANTYIGAQAGYNQSTGDHNTFIGGGTGYTATTGSGNTFIGRSAGGAGAGRDVTTGGKNIIIGGYTGNQGGLDIRTASNYIVLSDGDGNLLISTNSTRSVALYGAAPQTGTGITFPATQNASSDANTLDDYEEGTWTPNQGAGLTVVGTFGSAGTYVKIGKQVNVQFRLTGSTSVAFTAGANILTSNLPFTVAGGTYVTGTMTNDAIAFTGTCMVFNGTTNAYACTTGTANANYYFNVTYTTS